MGFTLANESWRVKKSQWAGLLVVLMTAIAVFSNTLAVDYFLGKENPFVYHLTNVLLHGFVSVLVYLFASRILLSQGQALFAGLVFSLNRVHTEAVAYIAARNEMLCALFMMGAFLFYLHRESSGRLWPLFLSLGFYFCSLLSKEMSATFPLLVFLFVVGIKKAPAKKATISTLPYFAVLAIYLLVRTFVLSETTWSSHPFLVRAYTAVSIVLTYFKLLFFPVNPKLFSISPCNLSFFSPQCFSPSFV